MQVEQEQSNQQMLNQARELVQLLEMGERGEADRLLERMRSERDASLFSEIGKLTRQLHEALVSFQLDSRITDMAAHDMPDARDRLMYVINMTEQAANKTMDGLDKVMPEVSSVAQQAGLLHERLQKLMRKELTPGEFRDLCVDLDAHLDSTEGRLGTVQDALNDIVLAQDYQDLTGQVIRRVITLVQEVETSLVSLIRMFGQMSDFSAAKERPVEPPKGAEGPVVHPEQRADVVHGQDEVDALLSSLGF